MMRADSIKKTYRNEAFLKKIHLFESGIIWGIQVYANENVPCV